MIFDNFQTLIVRRHYLSNCSPIHSVNFTLAIPRDKLRHWHLPGSPSGDLPIWAEVLAGGCGGASQVHLGLKDYAILGNNTSGIHRKHILSFMGMFYRYMHSVINIYR